MSSNHQMCTFCFNCKYIFSLWRGFENIVKQNVKQKTIAKIFIQPPNYRLFYTSVTFLHLEIVRKFSEENFVIVLQSKIKYEISLFESIPRKKSVIL